MEKHNPSILDRLSYAFITIGTLTILLLYLHFPETCVNPSNSYTKSHIHFPKSTCDFTPRTYVPLEKRNRRIWSTKTWSNAVASYSSLFIALHAQDYLSNNSRVLISSAGAGHGVQALKKLGVDDVTAVELVESPPLVSRADPHNLPFLDGVFDLGFGVYLDRALFPNRYVGQIERTVKVGGVCVVSVEECGREEVEEIVKLFKKSRFIDAKNLTLAGESRTSILMRVKNQA